MNAFVFFWLAGMLATVAFFGLDAWLEGVPEVEE